MLDNGVIAGNMAIVQTLLFQTEPIKFKVDMSRLITLAIDHRRYPMARYLTDMLQLTPSSSS
ncbi:hypothetical protein SAMD00019534_116570 [Acytostelium subglobosum LB1]|uniref:hypothetical protein n=1 Tax=Acytostelium subglobosum LB1 TaxID=1410327 RepID=UPI000644BC88|nr:hypothetical protein SAMD00019534_116570 [Acytostelium subglobosum LB1]GAM28481.1 hypothetical protein SAMD00019534_116570 [Acytostelium subglobosum LB1]|eukprot:XP_012748520.1 hypothetical protein SAMD00019534_116570 [Acytostelium subglobosum LB1]